ncbi:MAG: site-specific integrase [Desulfurococcaceae archaeon]
MPKLDIVEAPDGILDLPNEDILKEFEASLEASGAGKDTIKAYMSAIRDFLSYIGNKPLREVTLRDVINWRNERLRTGFPGSKTLDREKWQVTLHYYSLFLRRFFQWLGLRVNVPRVKRNPPKIDTLTEEEVSRMLAVAKKPQDRLILLLLVSTGLRSRELLELKVEDVDPSRGVIRVRSAKYGKERLVTAPREVFELLSAWIKLNGLKPKDKLFKITYSALYKRLKTIAKKAGVDVSKIRPHVFRHTFATMAIKRGLSLPTLQRLLGHSDIRTTQIYLHLTIEDVKKEYEEKMGIIVEPRTCTKCSRVIPQDAVFCPYCGTTVSEALEATT